MRTNQLVDFVKKYMADEPVDAIIVGKPVTLQGEPSESMKYITPGIAKLRVLQLRIIRCYLGRLAPENRMAVKIYR